MGLFLGAIPHLVALMQPSCAYGVRWLSDVPFVGKHQLIIRYSRSSGAGGQHVNKTESKVDMRVRLDEIEMPAEVQSDLMRAREGLGREGTRLNGGYRDQGVVG